MTCCSQQIVSAQCLFDLTDAFDTVDHELLLLRPERQFCLHGTVQWRKISWISLACNTLWNISLSTFNLPRIHSFVLCCVHRILNSLQICSTTFLCLRFDVLYSTLCALQIIVLYCIVLYFESFDIFLFFATKSPAYTGWAKKLDHFWKLITFNSDELEPRDVLSASFFSKNSSEKLVTDHKLIFNVVVKYSLQIQQCRLWRYFCLQTWWFF